MAALDAFYDAFGTGDVALIAEFIASDAGRELIGATECRLVVALRGPSIEVAGSSTRIDAASLLRPVEWSWYESPRTRNKVVLDDAIEHGHDNVVLWFFNAPLPISIMPATLVHLFPRTCTSAMRANDRCLLEMLLASRVWIEHFTGADRQSLLTSLLGSKPAYIRSDMIELLLAHGATVDLIALMRCACVAELDQVAVLLRNGACIVGSHVLSQPSYFGRAAIVRRLVECGADLANGRVRALYFAAMQGYADVVEVLLEEGFADVDAKTERERTAMMVVPEKRAGCRPRSSHLLVKELLLRYGASEL